MKKQWLITCVLVMSVLAFAACGKKQESAAGEGDQTGAVQETEAEATEEVKEEVEDAALAGTDLLAGAENAGDAASDAIAMQADILADFTGEIRALKTAAGRMRSASAHRWAIRPGRDRNLPYPDPLGRQCQRGCHLGNQRNL